MSSRHHNEHHKAQSTARPPNISFCSQNSRSAGTCTKMRLKKNSLDVWGISSLRLFSFVLIQFVQHTVYSSLVCYRDLTLSKCCMMPVAWDTSTPATISVKGRLGTMLVRDFRSLALKRLMDTQITISEAKWSRFSVSLRTWMDNLGTELHARFAGPLFIITDQFGKDLVPNMHHVYFAAWDLK